MTPKPTGTQNLWRSTAMETRWELLARCSVESTRHLLLTPEETLTRGAKDSLATARIQSSTPLRESFRTLRTESSRMSSPTTTAPYSMHPSVCTTSNQSAVQAKAAQTFKSQELVSPIPKNSRSDSLMVTSPKKCQRITIHKLAQSCAGLLYLKNYRNSTSI